MSGFTFVELLILIVVIGILAAITVVSYRGMSSRIFWTYSNQHEHRPDKIGLRPKNVQFLLLH